MFTVSIKLIYPVVWIKSQREAVFLRKEFNAEPIGVFFIQVAVFVFPWAVVVYSGDYVLSLVDRSFRSFNGLVEGVYQVEIFAE